MVYQFFNFGPNIIKWLMLIGTNRRACLILENEVNSTFFDLERGNAQGDTSSPYIFNLGYQILLFKLAFDFQIEGIIEAPAVPPDIQLPPGTVTNRHYKVFAYADDANLLIKPERASLLRLQEVLTDFGQISGLICNVEKTTIMQVGTGGPLPEEIMDLGFSPTDEVTILGLTLKGHGGS
jgi:hypothetical protein